MRKLTAIAIAAHPDDIEFCMAGTLMLLKESGYAIHYLNLASGSCGSLRHNAAATRAIRRAESRNAARILGAQHHPSLVDDLEILYELKTLRCLAAIIRAVNPRVVLTHSPQDYMEDHVNTCRLAVTASFARGMPNFRTMPMRAAQESDVTVYHAMPHGLRDGLRRRIIPGAFVNTTLVQKIKREALSAHRSQREWLDASQGMGSYVETMDAMSRSVGKLSRRFQHAEGWRRHQYLGFCAPEADPVREALGKNYRINQEYEKSLETGRGD